jgi:acetyl-CoA synthetase
MSSSVNDVYPIKPKIAECTYIHPKDYERLYRESIDNPDKFWREQAKFIDWIKPFTIVKNVSFAQKDFHIKWYEDGSLNVCYNCVDRHLLKHKDKIAILWEGNDPSQDKKITYGQLYTEVCRFANALKKLGIQKGDRVAIYLPMIPEAAYAMLACARVGAIHSVVFGGFSATALASRVDDCTAKLIITADFARRGPKLIPLKSTVDEAVTKLENKSVEHVLLITNTGDECPFNASLDIHYDVFAKDLSTDCPYEEMNAEDPLFILYTSGSTGKPKGVLHTSGGYLVYAALTHKYVFDYHENDIYWCTADVGWVTGHSYFLYGPLANGATSLMFEGIPTYPTPSRFWEVIDKHQVTIFYTAPTAIRALMREGNTLVSKTSRKSLRIIGSVGEPLNVEAWEWYYKIVGDERCPIVDTWWQTETGGILITPLPGATQLKPGSVGKPFFGIEPILYDNQNHIIDDAGEGNLAIKNSWPGQMRGVFQGGDRFFNTYFVAFPGMYTTGDGARRDQNGYYWVTGRVDDVINVSGHRLGTAEIESALDFHEKVAETAVVGIPNDVKGQGIHAFVLLKAGATVSKDFEQELIELVYNNIGHIAKLEVITVVPGLPKTRSGKIMRRILRKLACGEADQVGDVSTLSEPEIVKVITELLEKSNRQAAI